MKNTLLDLNNHLFSALERLNDENLSEEGLATEIKRSTAMANIASAIIENAQTQLKAVIVAGDVQGVRVAVPAELLENKSNG